MKPGVQQALLDRIGRDVKEFGHSVIAVQDGDQSFYYTVGRAKRGLPELLLLCPLTAETGQDLLNTLSEQMPVAVVSGERVSLGGQHPVMILDAAPRAKTKYTRVAQVFNQGNYRVQQVVLCDAAGRFPPDPACEAPWNQQPLLGTPWWSSRGHDA
jgi:hypothetical protein